MLQSVSTSNTWASSAGAAVDEAPHALTYKVEVYTGDVRGAGTHVCPLIHPLLVPMDTCPICIPLHAETAA